MLLATCIERQAGRIAVALLTAAAAGCVFSAEADAAPSCPEQTLRTPYMTPVTTTLACTDPLHPIVRYLPFQYPSATFTIARAPHLRGQAQEELTRGARGVRRRPT